MSATSVEQLLTVLTDSRCVEPLQYFAAGRVSRQRKKLQLAVYDDYEAVVANFTVKKLDASCAILLWSDSKEEVVLDCQGLLAAAYLPPVTDRMKFPTKAAHMTAQSVTIVGPDVDEFRRAISAVSKIYRFVEQHFGAGAVRPLQSDRIGDYDALIVRSRYVTPNNIKLWPTTSIPEVIDPRGILGRIVGSGAYKFTEDNVVQYRETVVDHANKAVSVEDANPSVFRQGQLVEVGLSFRAVMVGKQYTFFPKLESMLLANRTGATILADTLEASRSESNAMAVDEMPVIVRKRQVSYTLDDVIEDARKRAETTM
ncbi:hypothetical protein A0H81_10159 [Grifola frondosa]|uniref:Uncharacterized protein n=1 Tax=Grifola frondosa TaxID=5627 RepID=A0A1C7LYN4_GRIFR|nr:hypothetical protein A0H81_10159 [Grifola frondosa]